MINIDAHRVTPSLGLVPEDIGLIAPNQDFSFAHRDGSIIGKISRSFFQPFVGDVLITQENSGGVGNLFIVHWNGVDFDIRPIDLGLDNVEHVTFAPVDLPAQ